MSNSLVLPIILIELEEIMIIHTYMMLCKLSNNFDQLGLIKLEICTAALFSIFINIWSTYNTNMR